MTATRISYLSERFHYSPGVLCIHLSTSTSAQLGDKQVWLSKHAVFMLEGSLLQGTGYHCLFSNTHSSGISLLQTLLCQLKRDLIN